jgi:hypothetical protein
MGDTTNKNCGQKRDGAGKYTDRHNILVSGCVIMVTSLSFYWLLTVLCCNVVLSFKFAYNFRKVFIIFVPMLNYKSLMLNYNFKH